MAKCFMNLSLCSDSNRADMTSKMLTLSSRVYSDWISVSNVSKC